MHFENIKTKFNLEDLEQNGQNYIKFETDFETVLINTDKPERFHESAEFLLRFLNDELFDDECSPEMRQLEECFFLPSHKEKKLIDSLSKRELNQDLKDYYLKYMLKDMIINTEEVEATSNYSDANVSHDSRGGVGTSFFKIEFPEKGELSGEIELPEEVELTDPFEIAKNVALQIKTQIASMEDYEVAIGEIKENTGLLERGSKERTKKPSSRHYHFWKINKEKNGVTFKSIAQNFEIVCI